MKKTSILLLLISFLFGGLYAQGTVSPAMPEPGQDLTIEFSTADSKLLAKDDVQLLVMTYTSDGPEMLEPALSKSDKGYSASLKANKEVLAYSYALVSGEQMANNGGEGNLVYLYDAKGSILPESQVAGAMLYRDYGRNFNLNRKAAVAAELFESGFAREKGLYRKYLKNYLYCLQSLKRDAEGKKEIESFLTKIEKDKDLTEDNYMIMASTWDRLGKNDKALELREKMRAAYPDGMQVMADRKKAISAVSELIKKEEMIAKLKVDFPPANDDELTAFHYMWMDLAEDYAELRDWFHFDNLARLLPGDKRASLYNNLAWGYAEKDELLDRALAWSKEAYEISKSQHESPSLEKPALMTEKEWKDRNSYSYAMYADTYAYVLNKNGKSKDAEAIQKAVVELTDALNSDMNSRYAEYMQANGSANLMPFIKTAIVAGHSTGDMKAMYREGYAKNHSAEATKAHMEELEKAARAHMREELEGKMLDTEAPAFTLTSMAGETVSLESLKGKVVVVDFWATWCGPCKASFPGMQKAVNKYKDNENVVFLFVDTWERAANKEENAKKFIDSKGYNFNVLMDNDNKVVESFGVRGIPTKFIIDTDGTIRFKSVGFSGSDDALVDELTLMIDIAGE